MMVSRHEVNWQPLSMVPTIGDLVARALADSREHVLALMEAQDRAYELSNADLDRSHRVYSEQLEFVAIYTKQISLWRDVELSRDQRQAIDCIAADNTKLSILTWQVLALVDTLRASTIDVELGREALWRGASLELVAEALREEIGFLPGGANSDVLALWKRQGRRAFEAEADQADAEQPS